MVLFGSAKDPSFSAEWRRQSFFFCDLPGLEYWSIQHKVCMWTCSVPVGVYKLPFYTCTVLWGWGGEGGGGGGGGGGGVVWELIQHSHVHSLFHC